MRAGWAAPFCPGDGLQAGLWYLAAGWRDTTRGTNFFLTDIGDCLIHGQNLYHLYQIVFNLLSDVDVK